MAACLPHSPSGRSPKPRRGACPGAAAGPALVQPGSVAHAASPSRACSARAIVVRRVWRARGHCCALKWIRSDGSASRESSPPRLAGGSTRYLPGPIPQACRRKKK
eukprot:scaffold324_cov394-Prasinococcus_capsulatus_cf.AAC.14